MNEELKRIVEGAAQLFLQYGIKGNTMDDVARHLGVSKKTLYKHVSNKEDLLMQVVKVHFKHISSCIDELAEGAENAVDELLHVDKLMTQQAQLRNPVFIHELQRFYPEIWSMATKLRRQYVLKTFSANLSKGMEQGLYREDLNPEIIALLHLSRVESLTDPQLFPSDKFKHEEVSHQYVYYHMYGLLNEKGRKYLEQKLNH